MHRIILKIIKYVFIVFILIIIILSISFIKYSKYRNIILPKKYKVTVYDNNDNLFFEITNNTKQSYIEIDKIDPDIIKAIISIEDKSFYKHSGINVKRMGGAMIENIKSKSLKEGASTITQQYARNLFLSNKKTVKRKIDEIAIAINIESTYNKDQILEGYLNTIYFGHGIYGINDAAKFYYGKNASEVSLSIACSLASIPKGPSIYSPITNYEKNIERRNLILNELLKDKVITSEEYNEAINEKLTLSNHKYNDYNIEYYKDEVINELNKLNITSSSNISVYTNIDLGLQSLVTNTINKYIPNDDMQIAVFAMDPNTGKVLSVIGGKSYQQSFFNRSTKALRQPGSAIKPFLYYEALESGFTPVTTFLSEKTDFKTGNSIYSPSNYKNIYPNKNVTMAYALATSDNIYAVKTHLFLGTEKLVNTLRDFGFSTKIKNNPSLALGTSEVKLDELVNGYAKIASLGRDVQKHYINKIVDEKGQIIYETNYNNEIKFDKASTYILSETMTNMFDNNLSINISVTGAKIASMLSNKYAAKTGSTDTDNWIVGYNNRIVLGIWCGYDDNRKIDNGKGSFIKYVWAEIMEKYNYNKFDTWFEKPSNVISIILNPTYGKIAMNNEYSKKLYFKSSNIPWNIFDIFNENYVNINNDE